MSEETVDIALVGAGIMSATLGTLFRKLEPHARVAIFERLERAAAESSDAWNNAGTGHAGYCELNYTPEAEGGRVDCTKALKIAAQFATSLELWRSLVESGDLPDASSPNERSERGEQVSSPNERSERGEQVSSFVREVPHVSFVAGEEDVAFLHARHRSLVENERFREMEISEDPARIAEWCPLVMEGRDRSQRVAATRMARGTDVNFGALTRAMIASLAAQEGVAVHLSHEVCDLRRDEGTGEWCLDVRDLATGQERAVRARFVFIGAGGYSLSLLEKSGIPEAAGYGAFPVSGQWLRCNDRAVVQRHHAKVYGKAEVGAPPMSVPHLDSRWIDGRKELLFGPYAGFTTKFLKEGSWLDLLRSIGAHNIGPVVRSGMENLDLTRYLVGQAMLSVDERIALLRKYYPAADGDDWEVQVAGLRVQIIEADGHGNGELKFGTEVVTSTDGSIAALLGASPGASTAVSIMTELLARCFPARWSGADWRARLARVLPSLAA